MERLLLLPVSFLPWLRHRRRIRRYQFAIQELIPARDRGHIDLMINGNFWVGAALGALVAVALLNPALIYPEFGWRLAF